MQILNISGYKFIPLSDLALLREQFFIECSSLDLKGTILISHEGININISSSLDKIIAFKNYLNKDYRLRDIHFNESYSNIQPFKRLKVKIKKEIISLRQTNVDPVSNRAPSITPALFKQWLDDNRDILILDTRNEYEVRFGTFTNSLNLGLKHFTDFPASIQTLQHEKPIVMFCTGGIRCEKAALFMLNQGFKYVYQLEGGILNYFHEIGAHHYDGECFVFDERISVNAALKETTTSQCQSCQGPLTQKEVEEPNTKCFSCQ